MDDLYESCGKKIFHLFYKRVKAFTSTCLEGVTLIATRMVNRNSENNKNF